MFQAPTVKVAERLFLPLECVREGFSSTTEYCPAPSRSMNSSQVIRRRQSNIVARFRIRRPWTQEKRGWRLAGNPVGDLAGKEFVAFGLSTEVILGLGGLSRDGEVANPPSVIQVADDTAIGPGCVDASALGDGRKVVEKVMVLAVEHQLPRHGHEAPDHRAVSEHSLLWVSFPSPPG